MNIVITVGVFIAVLCILEGIVLMLKNKWDPEARRIQRQLKTFSHETEIHRTTDITRKRVLSSIPSLHAMLARIPQLSRIDNLLIQSNIKYPASVFLLTSLLLAVVGFYFAFLLASTLLLAAPVAVLMGLIPYFVASIKKNQRMKKFERQLPEALDLVARSLRAGHAFSGGLQMVADEFDAPLGAEFQRTIAQINLGVSIEQALKNLADRVDCSDLKFFAVSVIIQRESGGNLAEILESISNLIRGRFKLRGKIRTLTAEGKLSAAILIGIPFFIALALSLISPEYIRVLSTDPTGKLLVGAALIMMGLGVAWMKKMITLKV
ncbi:MAG TPA: type II secretion system F family protein [Syntrophorhabdales bacterium]|nr:type II secretion system F family protein [Syntrophorhabdales bacterium]